MTREDRAAAGPVAQPDWLDQAGLAALFGLRRATMPAKLALWQRDGFPAPLPWNSRARMWNRQSVERWKARREAAVGATGEPPLPRLMQGGRP